MEASAVVPAADERDVRERIQVGEDPHAIHHDHRSGGRVLHLRQPDGAGQADARGRLRDAGEVVRVGLVGREHQSRAGHLRQQVHERREDHRFVRRPGGPGDDGERARGRDGEARERIARAVEAFRPLGHAVVPRVSRHLDGPGTRAQLLEAPAVLFADRADPLERAVGGLGPASGRPAEPRAVRCDGGGDEPELHAAPRRREGQLGPHVELREHERRGLKRLEYGGHVRGAVERQVIRHIDRQGAREPLGGGGEEGVRELPVRRLGAHGFEHRLRLEALAHRRGVHPQERPLGIAVRPRPGGQTLPHAATRIEAARELLVEAGGEGQGPLREPDAEPVYEGRARPPHQRAPAAVLLW